MYVEWLRLSVWYNICNNSTDTCTLKSFVLNSCVFTLNSFPWLLITQKNNIGLKILSITSEWKSSFVVFYRKKIGILMIGEKRNFYYLFSPNSPQGDCILRMATPHASPSLSATVTITPVVFRVPAPALWLCLCQPLALYDSKNHLVASSATLPKQFMKSRHKNRKICIVLLSKSAS